MSYRTRYVRDGYSRGSIHNLGKLDAFWNQALMARVGSDRVSRAVRRLRVAVAVSLSEVSWVGRLPGPAVRWHGIIMMGNHASLKCCTWLWRVFKLVPAMEKRVMSSRCSRKTMFCGIAQVIGTN